LALTPNPPGQYRTKQEYVYRSLRDAILHCDLDPGARLVIDDLARQLNVSAIPVREALQLLQSEGFVVNVPHVGATVSPVSRESIDEVFTLMEGLEIVATRSAALRMTSEEAEELTDVVGAMDEAVADGRHEEWADLNTRFHLGITRVSAMPLLTDMMERVLVRWDRVRRYYFSGVLVHRIQLAQAEHREILKAMRMRELPILEAAVKQHNQGALVAYNEFLKGAAADAAVIRPSA
jgi:DNA-binding GntR family transcriptional regulator